MKIIYNEASGFWLGKPWLVVEDDGEVAKGTFTTKEEAEEFLREELSQ